MTSISSNPLSSTLARAFGKVDHNRDGKLDPDEFSSFNEFLKPGIAVDADGEPTVDYSKRMDLDGDGSITMDEMQQTPVLMPASLTDPTLSAMWDYLSRLDDPAAQAAAMLIAPDDQTTE